ncbi:hypothetical protein A2U01_0099077, partial [Trifolium medium]|nr:hypothetical protein [Trifolium medium]
KGQIAALEDNLANVSGHIL